MSRSLNECAATSGARAGGSGTRGNPGRPHNLHHSSPTAGACCASGPLPPSKEA